MAKRHTTTLPMVTSAAATVFLCAACGPPPNCPPQPAPPADAAQPTAEPAPPQPTTARAAGPGQLDPELAKLASSAKGVHKIKLRFDDQGRVQKLAIYHEDATQLPAEVTKLALEKFPGATVRYYESEHYADLGRVHEVEVRTKDGRSCELSRTAAGKTLYTECELAIDAVPAPVSKAIAQAFPKGKIIGAEQKDWADGRKHCHLKVEVDKTVHYVVLELDGKILERYLRIPATVDIPVPASQ